MSLTKVDFLSPKKQVESPVKALIMSKAEPTRPMRVPRSQLNVPEHIRKYSLLKSEAKDLINVE